MARRQPYEHNATPPAPEAQADVLPPEPKIDPFIQSLNPAGIAPLEVNLDDEPDLQISESTRASEPEVVAAEPEPKPEPVAQPKVSADDEAYNRLKAQLDREKAAREAAQARANQFETDHLATQERLRQEQERIQIVERDRLDAQSVALDNAISYAESLANQAQREIHRASSEGDYEASTAAYRTLAKAENDLSRLREGKTAVEAQQNAPVARPEPTHQAPAQQQPQNTYERIEAYIKQPAHSDRAQQYMRDHYDDLFRDFDNGAQRLSKLVGGHWLAKSDGVIEGSDAYFDHLDRVMGYKEAPAVASEPVKATPQAPTAPKKAIPPSAPVSRSQGTDSSSGTSVTLTPAQVALCRETGVSPRDYARHLLKIKAGADDPAYTGPRFTGDLR